MLFLCVYGIIYTRSIQAHTEYNKHTETEGNEMTAAAAEARRAYKRKWNRANRDKVRAHQERYWSKKAAEAKAATQTQEQGGGESD